MGCLQSRYCGSAAKTSVAPRILTLFVYADDDMTLVVNSTSELQRKATVAYDLVFDSCEE